MHFQTRLCWLLAAAPAEYARDNGSARSDFAILMTTLVTGATGFVGGHVARQLVAAGDAVRVLVRRSSNLAVLDGLQVEPFEGDLSDGSSLERAMQGMRRVYHVAADYRLWTPKPAEIYESN